MSTEEDITTSRTLVSMPGEFTERMKEYSEKKDIAFSALIREALRLYTNDDDDCFVVLAKKHAGSEASDLSAFALEKHKIIQSHFLGHIIREASETLQQLKEGDSWKDIKCVLKTNEGHQTPPDDPTLKAAAQIESQIDRNIRKGKKAG